jgi:D-alanyl-D-alanine carboxypeptidase (penicillin-binding protein 5/6)
MRSLSKLTISSFLFVILFSASHSNAQGIQLNADKRAKGLLTESADFQPSISDFQTDAKQAILVDFNTDTVLFEKEAETKMFPSSMTKVLTMYLVFDQLRKGHINMDTEFSVSERSWKTGGSQMFLEVGNTVKVSDLIQGVIVQSGNDGCVALAEGISGSVEAFVEDMNSVASQLGMKNTNFQNPDGLPAENHYSTAKDLSIVARRLITDFPEYYNFYSQREFTYNNIRQFNRNRLLDKEDLGVDGMKTGYTEMGGYGLIATGVKDNRRLIAVVNGLKTNRERLAAAEKLLRYGYSNFRNIKLFNKFETLANVGVWGGKETSVPAATSSDIEILVNRRDYNFNNIKTFVAYRSPWVAPIKKGDNIATLVVKNQSGEILKQFPLYATKDVEKANIFMKFIQKIKFLITGKY